MKTLKNFKLSKTATNTVVGGAAELSNNPGFSSTWQKTYAKSDKDKTGPYWEDTVD